MNYWWVNQNQTYRQEVGGGYLWSPKVNANGNRNQFYENMTKVEVGDLVFSFCNTVIPAIGIVTRKAFSQPKPTEFGQAGDYWGDDGWCVNVDYRELKTLIRPRDHMDLISSTLPDRYSPIQANGNGNQGVYLASVPEDMAMVLLRLIGHEADVIAGSLREEDLNQQEAEEVETEIKQNTSLEYTEKEQLVRSRRGQGVFRTNLERIEKACRVTGVEAKEHLRASHIKPWKDASNIERLDGYNGLLLSPHIDALFDRGFISFSDDGKLIISTALDVDVLNRWGVSAQMNVGTFTDKQKGYLSYHREMIFKK
jgi:hypothetical protein